MIYAGFLFLFGDGGRLKAGVGFKPVLTSYGLQT